MKRFSRATKILLVTNGMILIAGAMLGPIYALFVEKIGGSLLDASAAFGVFALAAGITTLVSARYSDNTMFVIMGSLCFASAIYIFRLPRKVL